MDINQHLRSAAADYKRVHPAPAAVVAAFASAVLGTTSSKHSRLLGQTPVTKASMEQKQVTRTHIHHQPYC
jgi:hypothetical protein